MIRTDVYYAREEGACADHDGVRRYGLPRIEAHTPDTVVFEDDIVHCSFADVQVGIVEQQVLHVVRVEFPVHLRSRALLGIQYPGHG